MKSPHGKLWDEFYNIIRKNPPLVEEEDMELIDSNEEEDVHEQTPIENASADYCSHNIKVNSTSSTMSNRKCKIFYCYFCHLS